MDAPPLTSVVTRRFFRGCDLNLHNAGKTAQAHEQEGAPGVPERSKQKTLGLARSGIRRSMELLRETGKYTLPHCKDYLVGVDEAEGAHRRPRPITTLRQLKRRATLMLGPPSTYRSAFRSYFRPLGAFT